jgi:CheY-like chemotaxis protein
MMIIDGGIVRVLAIEDSAADRQLIREFFRCNKYQCELTFLPDGVEALEYLHQRGKYREVKLPHLILLDLNLPKMDGRVVLEDIKRTPQLEEIPVVVLTSSSSPADVHAVYQRHGNCYLVKPAELDDFERVVRQIETFWVETALLKAG